jgi:hypothetical protein
VPTTAADLWPTYYETRKLAHAAAATFPGYRRAEVRVELVTVPTHKTNVCEYLDNLIETHYRLAVIRTWGITPRGGLKSLPNGE